MANICGEYQFVKVLIRSEEKVEGHQIKMVDKEKKIKTGVHCDDLRHHLWSSLHSPMYIFTKINENNLTSF